MGKASKATKKFASSGQLKKTIQARRKHQQIRKRVSGTRKGKDGGYGKDDQRKDTNANEAEGGDDETEKKGRGAKSVKGITVDDFLGGGFMEGSDDEDDQEMGSDDDLSEDEDEDDLGDDIGDDESFGQVDDEGEAHLLELSKLAEKDPEFYKYLQENDKELLDFKAPQGEADSDDEEDDAMQVEDDVAEEVEQRMPILKLTIIRKWQKAILEQRSLRALRKLLIAFRSAVHMNEDDQVLAWSIDSSDVYNKLITTALKYTPVVLEHHVPYKTLANGKFKPPPQTPTFKSLQKLILSYFHNIIHLLSQLTTENTEIILSAVTESTKIIPYIIGSRKSVKAYLKKCLELWSSAQDNIRIAAFLAIRKLAAATDESIMDHVLKGTYLTLVRSSKSTTPYTLPSINLMKNSASEIFCLGTDHVAAYQHAFGYIRQLAIHLRNSMKVKSKEAYKQVYNWQYVHCIDFWCIVLARACDAQAERERGGQESELKALVYPLVQVSLGAIKLISNSRSYPFHLNVIRSLLHLIKHTETYIPIAPYILPILTSTLNPSSRPKSSTLRPLDMEVYIRAPQQYLKTRVYSEGLVEEAVYLLAEWLASRSVHGSIAFPEIVVPVTVVLRKSLKTAKTGTGSGKNGSGKDVGLVKGLAERIEESSRWVEQSRKNVTFGPGKLGDVEEWEREMREVKMDGGPLVKYVKVQTKIRQKRYKLIQKAREEANAKDDADDDDAILQDEDEDDE